MRILFAFTGATGADSAPLSGASGLDISSLEGALHKFMEAGLSDSTRRVYRASWNRFLSFTRAFSLPATPITAESAILFVAYLGSEGLSVSTIESYLAALRHFRVVSDPDCPFPSLHSPYMKILLRGIKHTQVQPTSARVRLPITASLMRRIKAQLSLPPTSCLKVLIWAACSVGFFGLASSLSRMASNSIPADTCHWRTLYLIRLHLGGGSW